MIMELYLGYCRGGYRSIGKRRRVGGVESREEALVCGRLDWIESGRNFRE